MSRLKQALSLPLCAAGICCGNAGGPPGESTAPPYRGAGNLSVHLPQPQSAAKTVSAFALPERSRHADYSAPWGFSQFRNTEPEAPAANAPGPWHPRTKLNTGLPAGAALKSSDAIDTLAPAADRSPGVSVSDKPVGR